MVITDSGGIQEEAPSLGKPVVVLRENTERPEGILYGSSVLVGHKKSKIIETVSNFIENAQLYDQVSKIANPYGDGSASTKIFNTLSESWNFE